MKSRIELLNECHQYHPNENPVFLPGDKVRDKRDASGKIYRIKGRTKLGMTETLFLEDVESRSQHHVSADTLIPYLEMVACYEEK